MIAKNIYVTYFIITTSTINNTNSLNFLCQPTNLIFNQFLAFDFDREGRSLRENAKKQKLSVTKKKREGGIISQSNIFFRKKIDMNIYIHIYDNQP